MSSSKSPSSGEEGDGSWSVLDGRPRPRPDPESAPRRRGSTADPSSATAASEISIVVSATNLLDDFTSLEGTAAAAAAAADDRPVGVVFFLAVIVFWFVGRGTLHV